MKTNDPANLTDLPDFIKYFEALSKSDEEFKKGMEKYAIANSLLSFYSERVSHKMNWTLVAVVFWALFAAFFHSPLVLFSFYVLIAFSIYYMVTLDLPTVKELMGEAECIQEEKNV